MIGIYRIYCLITGKSYIGQSKNIEERWKQHLYELKRNKHHSKKLQQDFNRYGEKFFIKEIIQLFPFYSKQILNREEKFWIEYYNSYYNGYNETKGNESRFK